MPDGPLIKRPVFYYPKKAAPRGGGFVILGTGEKETKMSEKFDAVIIGWGKGGKTLAAALAGRGQKVAMVEKSAQMYGGTCINTGCIPTKTLVHSAQFARWSKPQTYEQKNAFYQAALAKKNEVVRVLRRKNYDALHGLPGVTVFDGEGSFVSAKRVQIKKGHGTQEIEGDKIFINTGAGTVLPPVKGLENNPRAYTSATVLDLAALPRELVIVGGGYIGLEFASIFADFGSRVTVLEGLDRLLPRDDREVVACLQEIMQSRGVNFIFNAKAAALEDDVLAYTLPDGTQKTVKADAFLFAVGRAPATKGLNLEAAGVKTGPRGEVLVDERLRTSAPDIWALGDVKGGAQFTYVSLDDYRIIMADVFGQGGRAVKDREPIVYSMFTDPAFSQIGLTEEAAKAQGYKVKTKKVLVSAIPRAKTLQEAEGMMKAVVEETSGKILGVTLLSPDSAENINMASLAMKLGAKAEFLRDFVYTHPSMAETFNELFNL